MFYKLSLLCALLIPGIAGAQGSCPQGKIRVAVIGGGIAALTTAFELRDQACIEVHIYESREALGGKAEQRALECSGALGSSSPVLVNTGPEFLDARHEATVDLIKNINEALAAAGHATISTYTPPADEDWFKTAIFLPETVNPNLQGINQYELFDAYFFPSESSMLRRLDRLAEKVRMVLLGEGDASTRELVQSLNKMSVADLFKGDVLLNKASDQFQAYVDIQMRSLHGIGIDSLNAIVMLGHLNITFKHRGEAHNGIDFSMHHDESLFIKGGVNRLVEGLAQALEGKANIHLRRNVTSIVKGDDNKLALKIEGVDELQYYDRVVSTVPTHALNQISFQGFDEGQQQRSND